MVAFRSHLAILVLALTATHTARALQPAIASIEKSKPAQQAVAERIERIRRDLAAVDMPQRAWGAWTASLLQLPELAPDILAALRRAATEPHSESLKFLLHALLDAAIRLDARPTSEDLAAIERVGYFQSQLLLLASRDPFTHAKYLEDLRPMTAREARIATDNLLAVGAPTRAVVLLLLDARVHVLVRVHDEGLGVGGGGFTAGVACGRLKVPEGFPPTVFYELVPAPVKNAQMLAEGSQPIVARRIVHLVRTIRFSSGIERHDASQHALDLLRWIAEDRAAESPLAAEVVIDHTWTNAA